MSDLDYLNISHLPEVRQPIVLAAFAGWNDAGQAATFALTRLVESWNAVQFAELDPEEFFVFTESRPTVQLTPGGQRELVWPSNLFYAHLRPDSDHDVILLVGTEPQLKWKTYCSALVKLADIVEASSLITLGALLADVPHTAETIVTGFGSGPDLKGRLSELGVRSSSYEGPTGIVGALSDVWRSSGRSAISLWGSAPHYISAGPNPQVALALLRRVSSFLDLSVPTRRLEAEAETFRHRIDEALLENEEALEYVRQLEAHYESEEPPNPSPELLHELEEFLRGRRPPGDGE